MSTQQLSTDVATVYKSRMTLLEIMSTKFNYDISEYSGFSTSDVDAMMLTGQLDMLFDHTARLEKDVDNADGVAMTKTRSVADSRIYVRYLLRTAMNKPQLESIINDAFVLGKGTGLTSPLSQKDTLVVVVSGGAEGIAVQDALKFLWNSEKLMVIVQEIKRLKFNVLNHIYQPDDIHIASQSESDALFKKYGVTNEQLPTVWRFDPVAQVLCARPGQIICYHRKSQTATYTWYYRLVVD